MRNIEVMSTAELVGKLGQMEVVVIVGVVVGSEMLAKLIHTIPDLVADEEGLGVGIDLLMKLFGVLVGSGTACDGAAADGATGGWVAGGQSEGCWGQAPDSRRE